MELTDQDRIQAALARAEALRGKVPILSSIDSVYARDLNAIVTEISDLLGASSQSFEYPESSFFAELDKLQCNLDVMKSKIAQLISRLKAYARASGLS